MLFFLLGLPGCGKSTLGKKFAHVIRQPFYDLDQVIEEGEGLPISELFQSFGEEKFRETEKLYLNRLEKITTAVVATGGGTPCYHDNMDVINRMGTSIFLDTSPKEIANRLSENGIAKRPILKGKSREEICLTLESLRQIRLPFYTRAHITITHPSIHFSEELMRGFQGPGQ